ncbi:MAG TPA: peptide chain release factor N(5)-glutamine methyltransferase [Gammaproteobacteria bacterium]
MSATAPSGADGGSRPRVRRYGEAVAAGTRALSGGESGRLDAQLLLAHAAGVARSVVLAFPEREVDPAALARFEALVARRAAGEPLAYLIGEKEFFSLPLAVEPAVLVPRPETEHLVDEALARLPPAAEAPGRDVVVLDLGTGSGALALALKRQRPDLRVVGADRSAAALRVARANGERLGLDVCWVRSDWLAAFREAAFDAILCNPPYVRSGDPAFERGLRFEPRDALDGGADGLDAIRQVLAGAGRHLKPSGLLLLEHGHDQRADVAAIARAHGLVLVAAGRDLAGVDRYAVFARR